MSRVNSRPHRDRRWKNPDWKPQRPPAISIHDRTTIGKLIVQAIGMANMALLKAGVSHRLSRHDALRAADKAYLRHVGGISKYQPHQSERERARRIRQGRA